MTGTAKTHQLTGVARVAQIQRQYLILKAVLPTAPASQVPLVKTLLGQLSDEYKGLMGLPLAP